MLMFTFSCSFLLPFTFILKCLDFLQSSLPFGWHLQVNSRCFQSFVFPEMLRAAVQSFSSVFIRHKSIQQSSNLQLLSLKPIKDQKCVALLQFAVRSSLKWYKCLFAWKKTHQKVQLELAHLQKQLQEKIENKYLNPPGKTALLYLN